MPSRLELYENNYKQFDRIPSLKECIEKAVNDSTTEEVKETVEYWKKQALFYYRKLRALGYNPDANYTVIYSNSYKRKIVEKARRVAYGKNCCKNCKFR